MIAFISEYFKILVSIAVIIWEVPPLLYIKFGFFKMWFHDILHWHEPDDSPSWCDA